MSKRALYKMIHAIHVIILEFLYGVSFLFFFF